MAVVTLPKSKFDILQKKASLYEAILRAVPESKWGIEEYLPRRIREFMRNDRLDKKIKARAEKLLSS